MDLESVMKYSRRQEKWQAQVSLMWHYLVMDVVVQELSLNSEEGAGEKAEGVLGDERSECCWG